MSKYGVLIMGPAGAGKSTFCAALISHLRSLKRSAIYINLDPAATAFTYTPDLDIRDLISLDDVMEELSLGPNGGLIYCFEFLLANIEFLTDALEDVSEEYLVIIDMPGQIELYTHVPVVPVLARQLGPEGLGMRLCAAYLLEATFMVDRGKFFSGALSAMSAMLMIELPHVNVLSKMDLVRESVSRRDLKRFVDADAGLLDEGTGGTVIGPPGEEESVEEDVATKESMMSGGAYERLNRAVGKLIDDYGMVSFLKLDAQNEDSVNGVLSYIDDCIQFHEAQEPREPAEMEM